jgi:hypothetical protein
MSKYGGDRLSLMRLKELVSEFGGIVATQFSTETIIDKDSLSSAISYVDVTLDMEFAKLNELEFPELDEHSQN